MNKQYIIDVLCIQKDNRASVLLYVVEEISHSGSSYTLKCLVNHCTKTKRLTF